MTTMLLFRSFTILLCATYVKTTNVTGENGNNVTLKVPEMNIQDITWLFGHNRIASTGPQKPINATRTYRGKLASDPDGSLIILNLQQEDNGMYSASIKLRNGEMRTAQYQLQVYHVKTTNVTGENGNNVTLKVPEMNIQDITWLFGHNRIASTGPQKPINSTRTYSGKLASDPDGSLIILNLQQEDNGMYSASIKLRNGEMRTAQYQLQVYHVKTTNVTGENGNNVTLKVPEMNIQDITWLFGNNRIASTGPQKPINATRTYSGKLVSDPDGSLIILNLQQEDNGMYSASIKLRNGEMRTAQYQLQVYPKLSEEDIKIEHNVFTHELCHMTLNCTANSFDVIIFWNNSNLNGTHNVMDVRDPGPETRYTCIVQNPISHSSKSVIPWEFCKKESISWITVIVSVTPIILIGAIVGLTYLYCKRQTDPTADITLQQCSRTRGSSSG
ncbi:cell adhesion molecule CEACAM3-like [Dendrobates tinctorius]|uniref:cell adhesion molecule CEACAM3-like n=1 Tax=Dendrobates tinctorius TaxID=92724 RepID=UPI003CC9C494